MPRVGSANAKPQDFAQRRGAFHRDGQLYALVTCVVLTRLVQIDAGGCLIEG